MKQVIIVMKIDHLQHHLLVHKNLMIVVINIKRNVRLWKVNVNLCRKNFGIFGEERNSHQKYDHKRLTQNPLTHWKRKLW